MLKRNPPTLPSLMKHLILPLALALTAGFAPRAFQAAAPQAATPQVEPAVAPVTVIALRHAEKGTDDPRDPHLSEAGTARAAELARLLSHAGVTHLFSTPYHRTRDTLAPLAAALELDVEPYIPADMDALHKRLAALPPGSVAVVAGHSNTTPGVVLALGGTIAELGSHRGAPALDEAEFDRAFVVTLATATTEAKCLELRYGAAR